MNIAEMVKNYNSELLDGELPMTFSEMCVRMRAKGLTLSHADTARGYIEDANEHLAYLETDYAKIVWTDEELVEMVAFTLDHRAFWQKELDKCKPSDIEIARQANNLHYAIEHKLGTDAQRQQAIDRFIEEVV